MKNALNSVKVQAPQTASFDLTHDVKLSCRMGDLVPVLAMECIPGDRVKLGSENLMRLAPMLAPLMHRVDVRVEYFFVPNRLLWENWETWITNGGSEPTLENPLPAHPYFYYKKPATYSPVTAAEYNRLMDYMGLPNPAQTTYSIEYEKISALPFGAYQLIYNEYYRDENLQDSVIAEHGTPILQDGNNTSQAELFNIRKRAWEADYFTKALPFAQKGNAVDLPMNFENVLVSMQEQNPPSGNTQNLVVGTGIPVGGAETAIMNIDDSGNPLWGPGTLYAETSGLSANTTINDLRTAYRLQEWLEKNARGGTRYSELIRSHFNVFPEDARLQRPEYIVGTKNPIQISEVLNTTGTLEAPQGNMSGHGISYDSGNIGKYYCKEHGYIIGILSIMPKTAYQQGIPKHFLKYTDPTELAFPSFANLGEQPILNKELMAFNADGTDTFGYTPRYMEYKTMPNRVAGDFRTTLDFWHMGRIFDTGTPPALNSAFVTANPTDRIFAVQDEDADYVWCQIVHHITAVRALPFYGTPTF